MSVRKTTFVSMSKRILPHNEAGTLLVAIISSLFGRALVNGFNDSS
ncbi:hypothetical protein DOQ08_01075 [Marinobacter litoralis]|uniref:Uncharacterized protein n=1 Tax=Marinobacter litoralis TaxID=187981 RepID=A0A3M2RM64_9GAMM|nr:hypothetical protein DOQ08_01075 [Marinobacter litoralis]